MRRARKSGIYIQTSYHLVMAIRKHIGDTGPVAREGRPELSLTEQDALFREAVAAIDVGDVAALERLIAANPSLVSERLEAPGAWLQDGVGKALEGFFNRPYLLWFVAEDPVRNGKLPANIAAVATLIVDHARRADVSSLQAQLDYALTLVSWSWIARACGVQIALLDFLINAGANLASNVNDALVNGNHDAAAHLIARGAPVTLAAALILERWDDVDRYLPGAEEGVLRFSFVLSSLDGRAEATA
jgi:hypothetical protein